MEIISALDRSAIKIQKRVRIWIAKRVFASKKKRHFAAIKIQTRMRVYLAKARVIRIKEANKAKTDHLVTIIQKNIRRFIAIMWRRKELRLLDARLDKEREEAMALALAEGREYVDPEEPPVSSWIDTYGVDPDYRLKRNRRITERLFAQLLRMKYVRLVTRFGVVYNDSYPPRQFEGDSPAPAAAPAAAPSTEGDATAAPAELDKNAFVSVYFPNFLPVAVRRSVAIQSFSKFNHFAVLHLESSVYMRKSVEYNIVTIQCLVRQKMARQRFLQMIRVHRAIAKFQRIFRYRYAKIHRAATMITSLFRMICERRKVGRIKREKYAAWTIQCAYRSYVARSVMFDKRSVEKLSVLKSSPSSVDNHGAERALEHRSDTFWIAESPEKAEIRIEFGKVEHITQVWLMTSTFSASPNFVSIFAVLEGQKSFHTLFDKAELPLLKQNRWHKFVIPLTAAKYFYFIFESNYGDDKYISLRQIRFLRSKESKFTRS